MHNVHTLYNARLCVILDLGVCSPSHGYSCLGHAIGQLNVPEQFIQAPSFTILKVLWAVAWD